MLSEAAIRPSLTRSTVVAVSHQRLSVQIGGQKLELPWKSVRGISAGHIPVAAGAWHLALTIDVQVDAGEHVLIATEVDRAWAALTAVLPEVLDVPPIDMWAPVVLARAVPLSIYERPGAENGRAGLH